MIELRGITWNHTRGYLPMVATAQRFSELHPDVSIDWEKQSLQEFGDLPLDRLGNRFDLLVIDHPLIGMASERDVLLPLDEYLAEDFLAEQAGNSVGRSHESYFFGDHQWALAVDAAAPVSGWHPELLDAADLPVPGTWSEVLELARRGIVGLPGTPIDSLMNFYILCMGLGEEPFSGVGTVVSSDIGIRALEFLRELAGLITPECATRNPIATWELLSSGNSIAFCPFSFGYSNYSRSGYAAHRIEFGNLVRIDGHLPCRSVLGGAGLAVSSACRHLDKAIEYCCFVASPNCQRGLYFESGGQPGHRSAWLDDEINRRSHGFFRNTLATLDDAWRRPLWIGYSDFQDIAASVLYKYIWGSGDARTVIRQLNELSTGDGASVPFGGTSYSGLVRPG